MVQQSHSQIETEPQQNWHGNLSLVYARTENGTQLIRNQCQAPLLVQRPFYPEGKNVCHSVILHTAGGVVGGDRLSCYFHLQPHAQVLITTAAAGKIYRSNGLPARQTVEIQIDADAGLEWLPRETIVFNKALYRQDLRVELATGAFLLSWEITRFGRTARGEKFLQGDWRSRTEIWRQGKPLWIDRQWLPASDKIFHSPHGLNGQAIAGSLVWIQKAVSQDFVTKVRQLAGYGVGEVGVTRLEHGFLCRYRGSSTAEVRNWFISVWQLVRGCFLDRAVCIPRVWQI